MQTIKRTVVQLDEGESITVETRRGETATSVTITADYRGDENEGTAMLVVKSDSHEMLDDDCKEISVATVESRKTTI